MRKTIGLSHFLPDCPEYWRNFISSEWEKSHRLIKNTQTTMGLPPTILNDVLRDYDGQYVHTTKVLMFKTEEDFALFCLKYS